MDAPCTVILVKQRLPFELLGASSASPAHGGYSDAGSDHTPALYGDDLGPLG
jgi:hypothetical protein